MKRIQELEKEQIIKRPKIKAGDIVSVYQKIEEGGKKRTQIFKGVIIKTQGSGSTKTFTVRRVSFGVGIERIYPLYHPLISRIKISRSSQVRRAKLYYLRGKKGKSAKLKEQAMTEEAIKSMDEQEEEIEKNEKKQEQEQGVEQEKKEKIESQELDKKEKPEKKEETEKEKSEGEKNEAEKPENSSEKSNNQNNQKGTETQVKQKVENS